ncbi:MAG TPA: lipoprotein [Burkholderiales bacterium]
MFVFHATVRRLVIVLLATAPLLGACGKKGPLYLPDAARPAAWADARLAADA